MSEEQYNEMPFGLHGTPYTLLTHRRGRSVILDVPEAGIAGVEVPLDVLDSRAEHTLTIDGTPVTIRLTGGRALVAIGGFYTGTMKPYEPLGSLRGWSIVCGLLCLLLPIALLWHRGSLLIPLFLMGCIGAACCLRLSRAPRPLAWRAGLSAAAAAAVGLISLLVR